MTAGPDLYWGVKQSLRDYIRALPDGQATCEGGAVAARAGGYRFPFAAAVPEGLRFGGVVGFQGHGGILRLAFEGPELIVREGVLILSIGSNDRHRFAIATGEGADPEDPVSWSRVELRLTAKGSRFFDGMYPLGTVLDGVVVGGEER